jgi:acyl-[acyl-carrier-protein]-phospholipid O-acyltransferase/long-chain-fatty-acid--[acyl-carrier-protein] ligase
VMLGYVRADKPGVLEPPPEGWHDTGDIVTIDEQGFVTIKGRAKRFAKVGGEMVSLAAVEMLAGDLWPDNMTAVAALPDPRKGERLVMVTDKHGATRSEFMIYARTRHASELMLPAESDGGAEIRPRAGRGEGGCGGVNYPPRIASTRSTMAPASPR